MNPIELARFILALFVAVAFSFVGADPMIHALTFIAAGSAAFGLGWITGRGAR